MGVNSLDNSWNWKRIINRSLKYIHFDHEALHIFVIETPRKLSPMRNFLQE